MLLVSNVLYRVYLWQSFKQDIFYNVIVYHIAAACEAGL